MLDLPDLEQEPEDERHYDHHRHRQSHAPELDTVSRLSPEPPVGEIANCGVAFRWTFLAPTTARGTPALPGGSAVRAAPVEPLRGADQIRPLGRGELVSGVPDAEPAEIHLGSGQEGSVRAGASMDSSRAPYSSTFPGFSHAVYSLTRAVRVWAM